MPAAVPLRPRSASRTPRLCKLLVALSALVGCTPRIVIPPAAARLNDQGAGALTRGELDSAARQLELALEYHPAFVQALSNLGLVELRRGNLSRAEQLLERAVRQDQDVAQPHNGLGLVDEALGATHDAAEHYLDALQIDPGFVEARANLGRLYYERGDYLLAQEQFEKLQHTAPERLEGFLGHAECLLATGRLDEAAQTLNTARARFGDTPALILAEGRRQILVEDFADAARTLAPLAKGDGDEAIEAQAWLSVLALARGDLKRAVAAARLCLSRAPDHALATYALASALAGLHAPGADAWLHRAAQLNPEHPQLAIADASKR